MSLLDELVNDFRLDDITFRALEECCDLTAGDRIIKSMMNNDHEYPVMGGGVVPTGKYDKYNFENAITISRAGSAGFVNWLPGKFWATDVCFVASSAKPDMLIKFLYYFIKNHQDDFKHHIYGGSMPKLDKKYLWRLPIPVLPLAAQRRIVEILDSFTDLDSVLEAELKLRKKQFTHYRDELLSFKNDTSVEWKPLSELGEFIRGKRFTKEDYTSEGLPVIHYGEIYTQFGTYTKNVKSHVRADLGHKLRYALPGDVVLTDVGETVDDVGKAVAWLGEYEVAIHDHCYAFRHTMNPKFVSYYMQTSKFRSDKAKYIARTKVNTLLIKGFSKVLIPVPPMERQDKIVSILENFDTLINDRTNGIPAEIHLRRKQYQFYRNQLLSFQEMAA